MKLTKKAWINIAVVLGVFVAIGALWLIKNGSGRDADESVAAVAAVVSGPLHITGPFELASLRGAGLPLIIDFGADSCVPCKEMAPVLTELHSAKKGKALIRFVDVWKYQSLSRDFPVQVIPTQFFFDSEGKPFTPPESLGIPMTQYSRKDSGEHVFTAHEGGLNKEQMLVILEAMGMKE